MSARVLQTLQMSLLGGIHGTSTRSQGHPCSCAYFKHSNCSPKATYSHVISSQGHPFSCKYFKALQVSIRGRNTARPLVPRTPALARVLQTLQVSLQGGLRALHATSSRRNSFISSRRSRRCPDVCDASSRPRPNRPFAAAPNARRGMSSAPMSRSHSFVSRGRPESSASRGASRSEARFSSRSDDAAAMEASSKSDTRRRAPASRERFSRRETASLARSLARSSEGAPARDRG